MLGILVAAMAFALAVTRVEDPDTWTHLALGRLMVESRGLPSHELFAFPSVALPYHDTEWLFDVVLYLIFRSAGLTGVVLLKDAALPREPAADRGLRTWIAAAVLLACLPMVRYRFVELPDLILMLCLGFTIFALDASR